jgi:hypothetical protein
MVKVLINALQVCGKSCLICSTTGIAPVQYRGGTTLHSLFRLEIDEQSTRSFCSNIGRGTLLARYILAADLIIVDEVSLLSPLVANRVSMTLQSISANNQIGHCRSVSSLSALLTLRVTFMDSIRSGFQIDGRRTSGALSNQRQFLVLQIASAAGARHEVSDLSV